ncbi:zinc-ribbon domain-containing protein [Paratissierella segnis]|uniref:Zinc-ribbon domain-containing protein n=1 Tax=Paratissierella segnis TaxID=2763679 RepID=A0A926EQS5_9FIRM|nr:zinc-ribbon domain-containing protein [Paratissierella segnis]MBC8587096.1 zinc-ribbon domain-containing protein [Paratissierella segnis]
MKRLTEETKLINRYPEVAKEFDKEKNEIDINKVSYGSGKKVWWKCPKCGQSWEAAVYNRTLNKQGCPYCVEKNPKASAINCVATMLPQLLPFWDYKRNGDITPWNTCYQSHKKVWWICPDNSEHRYLASVQLRSKGHGQCTICKKLKREQRENKKRRK